MSVQQVGILPAELMELLIGVNGVKTNVLVMHKDIIDVKLHMQRLIGEISRARKDIEDANNILSNLRPLANGYEMFELKMGIFYQVTTEKIRKIIDIEKDAKLCAEDALEESHAYLTRLFNQLKLINNEHTSLIEIVKSGQKEMERMKDAQNYANNTATAGDDFVHLSIGELQNSELSHADNGLICAESEKYGAGTHKTRAAMSLISYKYMSSFYKHLKSIYSSDIRATFDRCVVLYEDVIKKSANTQVKFDETQEILQQLINKLVERMTIEKDCQKV
jgi:hypothetical protein